MSNTASILSFNGRDALATWGVIAPPTLHAVLLAPAAAKDPIQTEVRTEHGTRTVIAGGGVMLQKRELSLELHMRARNITEFNARFANFLDIFTAGWIMVESSLTPGLVFRCRYVSCTQFTAYNGRLAKFILRLEEPDPSNRSK